MKDLFTRTGTLIVCLLTFATLSAAQSTPEDLIGKILAALETKDRQALKSLTIPQADVKKLVWPTVAANMAGNTMNGEKFAGMYMNSSDVGIDEDLEKFGGRKWQLVKVAVNEPKKQTKGYRLLPAPMITLRDDSGAEKTVRLVGAILEKGGTFRVATYYVSPTQK